MQGAISIRKYKDEVYCDIVDMDAYHLLFGRPWQFDVGAQYSGKENIYRLEKNNKRYTLLPLTVMSRPKNSESAGQSILTIVNSEGGVKEVMKVTPEVHALVMKNVADLYPFNPNDAPLYPNKNSELSSSQVGKNDTTGVAM